MIGDSHHTSCHCCREWDGGEETCKSFKLRGEDIEIDISPLISTFQHHSRSHVPDPASIIAGGIMVRLRAEARENVYTPAGKKSHILFLRYTLILSFNWTSFVWFLILFQSSTPLCFRTNCQTCPQPRTGGLRQQVLWRDSRISPKAPRLLCAENPAKNSPVSPDYTRWLPRVWSPAGGSLGPECAPSRHPERGGFTTWLASVFPQRSDDLRRWGECIALWATDLDFWLNSSPFCSLKYFYQKYFSVMLFLCPLFHVAHSALLVSDTIC